MKYILRSVMLLLLLVVAPIVVFGQQKAEDFSEKDLLRELKAAAWSGLITENHTESRPVTHMVRTDDGAYLSIGAASMVIVEDSLDKVVLDSVIEVTGGLIVSFKYESTFTTSLYAIDGSVTIHLLRRSDGSYVSSNGDWEFSLVFEDCKLSSLQGTHQKGTWFSVGRSASSSRQELTSEELDELFAWRWETFEQPKTFGYLQ